LTSIGALGSIDHIVAKGRCIVASHGVIHDFGLWDNCKDINIKDINIEDIAIKKINLSDTQLCQTVSKNGSDHFATRCTIYCC